MSDPTLSEWIGLRRVNDGGVAKTAGIYLDHGRPTPAHLSEVFDRLIWGGLVALAQGDPVWSVRCCGLTDAGAARYAALCEQRQRAGPRVPPPEHGTQDGADG